MNNTYESSQWISIVGASIGIGILGGYIILQSISSYSLEEVHSKSIISSYIPNHTTYNANNYKNHLLHWSHI